MFQEAEKKMAKLLKEKGLEWEPKEGDWCFDSEQKVHLVSSLNCKTIESNKEEYTWLPLWHTCRRWITEQGISLTGANFSPERIAVVCRDPHTSSVLGGDGKTDLEAIYHLMFQIMTR